MLLPLVLLFIVVPIAELAVVIQVGQAIGVWWTIALLVADAILGSMLARAQGRAVWLRFNEALQAGRAPAREVMDGALVLFGGALLLTPGFLSDILGIVLLLPPTRALVRAILVRRFAGRMVASMTAGPGVRGPDARQPRGRQAYDVEGTAVDSPPDGLDPGSRSAT
ncbi:MAG TPA: FxsA family protein [Solirubrobacterales bacterium]|nr:FxsA family protein [Solirubrobacterales bacterium]